MYYKINHLVFEGGGVLGVAYLGVIDYLYHKNILQNIQKVAGTSAGAITACITSFNLPAEEIKAIADSLDYRKIPQNTTHPDLKKLPNFMIRELDNLFGDINSLYRLFQNYGWYSSEYFYTWLQHQIAKQFNPAKKKPPYTFADFRNPLYHKNNKPFMDLYVIGTNVSNSISQVFSYETTPDMEVASAVRISMSIPLFFEAIKTPDIYCDGGLMRNYPINIFDTMKTTTKYGSYMQTLGARFNSHPKHRQINNLLDYIRALNQALLAVQKDIYNNSPRDIARSIEIDTGDVSSIDFDISPGDETYQFLYKQGYIATEKHFQKRFLR